ncbi:tRNA(His) guanylyltransferase Thg1 family protein [Rhodocytophaga aerolata]|uniref:tRNA(His) guanylyltransferase n=1 Tax=Rhodocytophaga aerolata TaxID=455078 RepID=A0ABT8R450_9BACT|nr:tRNA(His) guanylyltransferase Thg1 family protein [Rhodocytophaga aerolata]MDO1446881.1 tRNA(His) guanylyltransferase Thg1 family protein [Rhodocytophaga aerolata]
MKFNDFDAKMRLYETAADQFVPPDLYMIARLDGRGFTKLSKEILDLEKPFSMEFRDAMISTMKHLMNSGFTIEYGYTQSDEISLLFHPNDQSFNRKYRKLLSVLAGEASAAFTHALQHIGVFDCRLCILPTLDLVTDYFLWRAEDAHRNSLNAYCYWKLREQGKSVAEATNRLQKLSVAEKNELLFQMNINYNTLPAWQKRGMGFYWQTVYKKGLNPVTNEETTVERRELLYELELPFPGYKEWLLHMLNKL